MSVERIRELLALMKENEVVEIELEEPEFKVKLKKQSAYPTPAPVMYFSPMAQQTGTALSHAPNNAEKSLVPLSASETAITETAPASADEGLIPVKSPIVGRFYKASSPDADPFVSVGSHVDKQTVVCVIESMKIMNEVTAGVEGVVLKVLVENGEPVQYGQPLFLISCS
jgi:acetyl-CoA carboxylase biotin carboxyl carrier protein